MKLKNSILLNNIIIAFILNLFVRLIYLLNKKSFHHPVIDKNKTYVISFWHGDLLMQPFNYFKLKNGNVKAMISHHKDGDMVTKLVHYLNVGSIRGSSSKGGLKALINAIRSIKDGIDVAITPDGPKGPIYSVADGIIALAHKTNCEILLFNSKPTSYWRLNSWDNFIIPKPFGSIDFYVSEPIDISNMSVADAKIFIRDKMLENSLK